MSIFAALTVGINGLQAQSNNLNVISENIANSNTVGFKSSTTNFETLISYANSAALYSPNGAVGTPSEQISLQGAINNTQSPTDLAISGSGFFAVSDTAASSKIMYTRAGSFTQDTSGNLVNGAGFFLKGWALDATGALPAALNTPSVDSATATAALTNVKIQNLSETPIATTSVSMIANLTASRAVYTGPPTYNATSNTANIASGSVAPQFTIPATIIDAKGTAHTFNVSFLKTAPLTWQVEIYAKTASDVTAANGQIGHGTLTFNGDASLASISPSLTQALPVTWAGTGAAAPSSITFNWGTAGQVFGTPNATAIGKTDGISQFDSAATLTPPSQNGVQPGKLINVTIDQNGYVAANFDNQTSQNFYKIPLASFADPDQLLSLTGNVYAQTTNAGSAAYLQAGASGVGTFAPKALEASTVDLAGQLSEMVVAQRAYQANSKTITVTDTMLQTLTQMGTN